MDTPSAVGDEVDLTGGPASASEIRDHLRSQPKPTKSQSYRLAEAEFWTHRHVPAGSVLTFTAGFVEESAAGICAVLVKERESFPDGMWLKVKCLGTEDKEFYGEFSKFFRKGRVYVHLCYGEKTTCTLLHEEGCHIDAFDWHPPGTFDAPWLSSTARKAVKEGPKMAAAESGDFEELPKRTGFTTLEDRLDRLKKRPHVTFAGAPASRRRDVADSGRAISQVGTVGPQGGLPPAPLALKDRIRVKQEAIPVDSDSEKSRKKKKKRRPRDVADRLALAVTERRDNSTRTERKRTRSRSKHGRKRKRKRHRRRSDSRSSSSRSRSKESSSSSNSLVPPLKKKSQKEPGSVLRLLENQVMEHLAQEGVLEEEYMADSGTGKRPKIFTFFQLALKPTLDPRSRDCREISLLARCLDMLREGRLASLADVLSARLLAVETATRQGWATARHLEVYGPEEEGPVPPHILLSAQRHQRQVEKAGGKGSWPKGGQWSWPEWQADARPKGRGKGEKGKGKKGKGRYKGKGGSEAKGESDKPKEPAT